MSTFFANFPPGGGGGVLTVANAAALPVSANNGALCITLDTHSLYEWTGAAWVLLVSTSTINAITALTGDVTATGSASSSVPATVAFVGGSSAASVHTSQLDTAAATDANTASTIVKRDGSGNFAASTITANLTGNCSGTSATFTGSLTGDVTSTAMATTVANGGPKYQTIYTAYVSPLANPTGANGSLAMPYQTMAAAIAAAPGVGITLFLLPGTYSESQVLVPQNTRVAGLGGRDSVVVTHGFACDAGWSASPTNGGIFTLESLTTGAMNFSPGSPFAFQSHTFTVQDVHFTSTFTVGINVNVYTVPSCVFDAAQAFITDGVILYDCDFAGLVTCTNSIATTFYRCSFSGGVTVQETQGGTTTFNAYNSFSVGTLTLENSLFNLGTLTLNMDPATYSGFQTFTTSFSGTPTVNFNVTGTTGTSQTRLKSAALSLVDSVAANVTSGLVLHAGVWDIVAMGGATITGGAPGPSGATFAISKTSATLPATDTTAVPTAGEVTGVLVDSGGVGTITLAPSRISLTRSTTYYLVAFAAIPGGAAVVYGSISAVPVV